MPETRIPMAAFRSLTLSGSEFILTTADAPPVEEPPPDPEPVPQPEPEPSPVPAGDVLRSADVWAKIGVNAHLNFGSYHDREEAMVLLRDLGVPFWRSAVGAASDPTGEAERLWQEAGMRGVCLVAPFTDGAVGPVFNKSTVTAFLNALKGKPWAMAVDGPNEALKNYAGKEAAAAQSVVAIQAHIYDTVKASAELRHLRVIGPSTYRRLSAAFDALAGTGHCDASNLHTYNNADPPEVAEMDRGKIVPHETLLTYAKKIDPSKPVAITECGWSSGSVDLRPTSFHLPEEVAASYLLRFLLLNATRPGVEMVVPYALLDQEGGASNWGLVGVAGEGSAAPFTPRRGYHALRRFMALLRDPNPPATPRGLAYRLEGDLADVQHMLFARGDGSHILAVWREVPEWDKARLTRINATPRSLTLGLPAQKHVTGHRPVVDDAEIAVGLGTRLGISVSADPLLLHIA